MTSGDVVVCSSPRRKETKRNKERKEILACAWDAFVSSALFVSMHASFLYSHSRNVGCFALASFSLFGPAMICCNKCGTSSESHGQSSRKQRKKKCNEETRTSLSFLGEKASFSCLCVNLACIYHRFFPFLCMCFELDRLLLNFFFVSVPSPRLCRGFLVCWFLICSVSVFGFSDLGHFFFERSSFAASR